jgi:hypothetical protein
MDEQENVNAGSETSGETADTAQADTADTSDTAQADAGAESAGGAAEPKVGDTCTCPDGRAGTIHSYDEGLICIPNQTQG